jgi:glycosyltransferase involved in cell wall biosynthesis
LRSVAVPLPPTDWGGLQAFAANLNRGLREAGWRWVVVVPPEALDVVQRLMEAEVDVLTSPLARFRRSPTLTAKSLFRMSHDVRALAATPELVNASIVQAVGAHHPHGAMLATRLHKPLVWQLHSNVIPALARRVVAPLISRRSDAIMTNGLEVAKAFWGSNTAKWPNLSVFYAPVDAARFAPAESVRREGRRDLGVADDEVVVGTLGNCVWQKNHEFLIKAAKEMAHLYPTLRFLILGESSQSYESDYERTVKHPVKILNRLYPDFVRIVKPGREVERWLQVLDVFALTSRAEGVPIALFEAMSAAKPVVSVRVGSISEVVEQGTTGFLTEPGDLTNYVERLTTLILNCDLRKAMGDAGRRRILSQFSIKRVVEAHIAAYEMALTRFECLTQ